MPHSHEIKQVPPAFGYPPIGNSASEIEVKLKLELGFLFKKSVVATFSDL